MDIDRITNIYDIKDKADKNLPNGTLPTKESGSIFSLMSNCIKKADTSGDGILSEEEISVFMSSGYNEVIAEFQSELENSGQEISDTFISQIKNLIGTMLKSSEEIEEDLSSLDGMTKDDFLKKATDAQSDEDTSMLWKLMGMDNAEGIFDKLDKDGNGSLTTEELEELAAFDGNRNNLSLKDLGNFFKEDSDEVSAEESQEIEEAQQTQNSPQISNSGFSGVPSNSSFTPTTNNQKKEERTVETINKEIADQEALKNTTTEKAKAAIAEQDELIANALEQSDLSDEFKEEYNSENERLTKAINSKDEEIDKEKALAQDYKAEAQSYDSSISDINSQISSMESAMSSLDKSENASKINEYNTKINNLKAKKIEYENAKREAEENEKQANGRIEKLKEEKNALTIEKDNILNTLSEKYSDEKDKALALKEEITQYETAKKEIQTQLDSAINEIDSKIQELKNEKVQLERTNETQKILDENRVEADTTPTAINGDISTFTTQDWEKLGYNKNYGSELANNAILATEELARIGQTKGNCLGGVKRAFIATEGSSPFGAPEQGITVASQCISVMEESDNFREVTGLSVYDLKNLPAGAVIVWSSSTSGSNPADKYGHISVSLGDGREASGIITTQYTSVGKNGKPRVFIPVH